MKGEIYLASASDRRRLLLEQMGLECRVLNVQCTEIMNQKLKGARLAENLARQKMEACLNRHPRLAPSSWIISADTLIEQEGQKLGKPSNRKEAAQMLEKLQGRRHRVITAYCLSFPKILKNTGKAAGASPSSRGLFTDSQTTEVCFSPMNREEIENYLNTEEWKGVAGAYRIQGQGGMYIASLKGSFYNVMGCINSQRSRTP